MGRKAYIVLHKSEWDRLHRSRDKTEHKKELCDQRVAYFKRLVEISQGWIKTWPDTVQGHVEQVKKDKKKHHQEEIDLIKHFLNQKKEENTKEAIQRAKQLIFEDSSYGKQLASALLESKTLEIRDRQIEFQKELKKTKQEEEKKVLSKLKLDRCSFGLDVTEDDDKRMKKEMEQELAKINKELHEMEISKKIKKKQEQQKIHLENARLMQELLDMEARQKKEYENQLRNDVQLHEREQTNARERKIEREKKHEEIAKTQSKELENKYCKIRNVLNDIHHPDIHKTERYKRNYELIKEIQHQEKARYDNFVQTGMKKLEDKTLKKEQDDTLKQKSEQNQRHMIFSFNKKTADMAGSFRVELKRICQSAGDRQCILAKSNDGRKKNMNSALEERQPTNFLVPARKFREQLEARKKEPSPWTATSAAHAQFAMQAGRVLQEAKYKHFARKVVDEYRKTNCLNATSLPVPNYK